MSDKLHHFSVGASIAILLGFLLSPLYGLLAAILAGAGKELYDHLNPTQHTADLWDFVATLAAALGLDSEELDALFTAGGAL